MDQGTAFMSRTLKELYELLGIKSIRTSVYHPQTDGLVERFNRTLKNMVRKFVKKTPKIGINGSSPCCSWCGRSHKPPLGFPHSSSCMVASPGGCLTSLRSLGGGGHQTAITKFSMSWTSEQISTPLGRLSMENLLEAQDKQMRLYNRGYAGCVNSRREIRYLFYFQRLVQNYSRSGKGPFVVTRRVGELDYEVKQTDRGDSCQIYHLNLLKRWNEGTSVGLAAVVSNEDDLGPEAALKNHPFALVSGGDHLSPRLLTDLAQLQEILQMCFHPCPVVRT